MIKSSDVSYFLKKPLHGPDFVIEGVCSLKNLKPHCIVFLKKGSKNAYELLRQKKEILLLLSPEDDRSDLIASKIFTENPRLDFARIVARYFVDTPQHLISDTCKVGLNSNIAPNVSIGHYTVVGKNVRIGEGTIIHNHVVIHDNTTIGNNCIIKSNTIIGEEGFGFEYDEDGTPFRFPHIGGVSIGNFVEIGALNTVVRGTLDNTIIEDYVKTDDHVHIAHNVHIEEGCMITACTEISGSVHVGRKTWLGPNCSLMNGTTIGAHAIVGLGAVVTKSIPDYAVVAGNPAKVLYIKK